MDKSHLSTGVPTVADGQSLTAYQLQQRQALAFTQSPAGKELLKRRPQIERVSAGLVRYNGARYAKAKGVAGANFQAKPAAGAYNRKRWCILIQERNKTKAGHSPPAIG